MKVSVHNLGVIKEAEIELKPLTVFIGPNNAGKTWLAYALSGVLGSYVLEKYISAYVSMPRTIADTYPVLDETIKQVLEKGNAKIDLSRFANEYTEAYLNNIASFAREWMNQFLGTARARFDQLAISFELGKTKAHLLEQIPRATLQSDISIGTRNQSPLLTLRKKQGDNTLFIFTSSEGQPSEALPEETIGERIVRAVFRIIHEALYPNIYFFPIERTTLSLLYPYSLFGVALESLVSRLFKYDERYPQKETRETSKPITQFLEMMTVLHESSTLERGKGTVNNSSTNIYRQLAQLLERQVLSGSVDFSLPEPDPERELLFQTSEGVTLEMPVVSSMVKELTPFVLYLRYLAQPGEWLIIDEPEMNLHPEAQAKLTEFLAMLVNAGLPVLITTHSPYIVDHLTNLMKAAESAEPAAIQDKFYLQNKDAFISKNDVSVYLVDEGKAENVLDEDGVVHWGTFGTVSDRVSEIFFEL